MLNTTKGNLQNPECCRVIKCENERFFWNYDRLFSPKQICLFWCAAQFIQSLCPLRWVYWALKLLKIYVMNRPRVERGLLKLILETQYTSWWWCFTSPFTNSTLMKYFGPFAPHLLQSRCNTPFSSQILVSTWLCKFSLKGRNVRVSKGKSPTDGNYWNLTGSEIVRNSSNVMPVHWA